MKNPMRLWLRRLTRGTLAGMFICAGAVWVDAAQLETGYTDTPCTPSE